MWGATAVLYQVTKEKILGVQQGGVRVSYVVELPTDGGSVVGGRGDQREVGATWSPGLDDLAS